MRVVVVTKTTNYELHGATMEAKVAQGRVSPEALQRLKTAHDEHYQCLAVLKSALDQCGVDYTVVSRDSPRPWPTPRDALITVGGDGTLLSATHEMAEGGLIAGIRSSVSSVGFLCCAGTEDVPDLVRRLVENRLKSVTVSRLLAEMERIDTGEVVTTEPVLNDFLYTNANPAATTRYKLSFRDVSEVHRSSGLWVATAAGSTAAILTAGGERMPLGDTRAQFRVRELYRMGHTVPFLTGGVFDPDKDLLEIENRSQQAILALDGQHGIFELSYGDRVRFRRAPPIELCR